MSEHAECWVGVPVRWDLVRATDVVITPRGPLMVTDVARWADEWSITLVRGWDPPFRMTTSDPAEPVPILIPSAEADAVALLRGALGARVVDRNPTGVRTV